MDWTNVMSLIDTKLLIVVVACWVVGFTLKQTPKIPNWTIIYVVTLFALVFTVSILGVTPVALLQGLLCGAVSVYGNQLVKQVKKATSDQDGV